MPPPAWPPIGRALTDSFSGIAPADVPGFVPAKLAGAGVAFLFAKGILGRSPASATRPGAGREGFERALMPRTNRVLEK